jgi:hypothetical protein
VLVTDSGLVADTGATALRSRYPSHRRARGNLLLGLRAVRFVPATGFDALRGTQDLKLGVQVGTTIGRTLSALGSDDNDIFVGTDVYAGFGGARAFGGLQMHVEGRRDRAGQRWDGVLASGRAAWYGRVSETQTLVTSVEYGAGWRQQVPFQLTLGEPDGGVRGFAGSQAGGARRVVVRMESRWYSGSVLDLGDLGTAAFVDVGRVSAGDSPYGTTTGPRIGAGVSLLAAVPARSKRTWRIDLAVPISPDRDAGWSIRFSSRDLTRSFYLTPEDIRRSRELTSPAEIFNWP